MLTLAPGLGGLALTSALLGITSHVTYFSRGDSAFYHVTLIFYCFLLIPILLLPILTLVANYSSLEALYTVGVAFWSFVGAIWFSMGVYRAFFHRLGGYPGPFAAKLTSLWRSGKNMRQESYVVLGELHEKYGEYVRTGPSEISITDPEAIELVLGSKTKCVKAIWYDVNLPMTSLHQTRDKKAHAQRRRDGWDKAFNATALRGYESRVLKYADLLVHQLSKLSGEPVNISKWCYFFGFDVMGDLAFGKSFDMLKTGQSHPVVNLLKNASRPLAWLNPIPWFFALVLNTAGGDLVKFINYSGEKVEERKKMTPEEPDIMSYLLDSPSTSRFSPAEEKNWLYGDSRLIIIAGSDTTTTTLGFASYYIAKYPSVAEKLRAELLEAGYDANPSDLSILQRLPYLNGVIDETLRLHPPVPSGAYRQSPPEGLQIGEHFIPGDITILTPHHLIQRLEKAYISPNEFIPERWSTRPELILNKDAFVPFALGHYGCIGKQLAYMELRAVIAKLVLAFDVEFAPGEDGSTLVEKSCDAFTMLIADLFLVLRAREGKGGL